VRTEWQWVECVARFILFFTTLILASLSFSQMMHTLNSIYLQILYCLFVIALLIAWGFDVCRLCPKRRQ